MQAVKQNTIIQLPPYLTNETKELNKRKVQTAYDIVCKVLKLNDKAQLKRVSMFQSDVREQDSEFFFDLNIFFVDYDNKKERKLILFKCIDSKGNLKIESEYLNKKDFLKIQEVK